MIADTVAAEVGRGDVAPVDRDGSIRWRRDAAQDIFYSRRKIVTHELVSERLQQCFGVHEVRRRQPFRVGTVDSRQRVAGLVAAALALPEPGEAHCGAKFPSPALLAACGFDGGVKALFGGGLVVRLS